MDKLLNAGLTIELEQSTYWKLFATIAGAGLFIIIALIMAKKFTT